MTMIRWQKPESSLAFAPWGNLQTEINRLFNEAFPDFGRTPSLMNAWGPTLDLYENKDNLTVKVELPGMKKEDIEISLQDDTLTVSGERKHEETLKDAETHRLERFYGRFQRSVAINVPVQADKIKATYADGVLTVVLPKAEQAKPRQIEINVK
jgi:HSP20 family protein